MIVEESVYGDLLALGRPYLLMLFAHPLDDIRRIAYTQVSDILSVRSNLLSDPLMRSPQGHAI